MRATHRSDRSRLGRLPKSNKLQLLNLEQRELPAAALTATFASGLLRVEGTDFPDRIVIRGVGQNVEVEGLSIFIGERVASSVPARSVRAIEVAGLGGDDHIELVTGVAGTVPIQKPSKLLGNDGDDVIIGGAGIDVIDGGAGDDNLQGRGGNDRLFGGADDDILNGGSGYDMVDGGDGVDQIVGATMNEIIQVNGRSLTGRVLLKWLTTGGEAGPLGAPITGESVVSNRGRFMHRTVEFAGGAIYFVQNGTFALEREIFDKWQSLNAEKGPWGYPTSDELSSGNSRLVHFQGGDVYETPLGVAAIGNGAIRDKWLAMGGANSVLGLPTSDKQATGDGVAQFVNFENGAIYDWAQGTVELHGPIYTKWSQLGSGGSALGYPIGDQQSTSGNSAQFVSFQSGAIYNWAQGTFELHGAVFAKWIELGSSTSVVGLPVTDVSTTTGRDGDAGSRGKFVNGGIYSWSEGTFTLQGAIFAKYIALGGEQVIGYPRSDQLPHPNGEGVYNRLEYLEAFRDPETNQYVETAIYSDATVGAFFFSPPPPGFEGFGLGGEDYWAQLRQLLQGTINPAGQFGWDEFPKIADHMARENISIPGETIPSQYRSPLSYFFGSLVDRIRIHWGAQLLNVLGKEPLVIDLRDPDKPIDAQTFADRYLPIVHVYIAWRRGERSADEEISLIMHEMVHANQYEQRGVGEAALRAFGRDYFTGFWTKVLTYGADTYSHIPLEVEAYNYQNANRSQLLRFLSNPFESGYYFNIYADIGGTAETPIVGDFNHDGYDDIGVYIPSPTNARWVVKINNRNGTFSSSYYFDIVSIGGNGEIPVVGDWNGDGWDDIGVYIPSSARWVGKRNLQNRTFASGFYFDDRVGFGGTGETPIIGDFDRDGYDDIALYIPISNSATRWVARRNLRNATFSSTSNYLFNFTEPFGGPGEIPIVGDFDGSGSDDIGVYIATSTSTRWVARVNRGDASFYSGYHFDIIDIGGPGETPIVGDFDGNGRTDMGVYIPSSNNARWVGKRKLV